MLVWVLCGTAIQQSWFAPQATRVACAAQSMHTVPFIASTPLRRSFAKAST